MLKFKYALCLLSTLILMGCGQTVVETLHVPDPPMPNAPGAGQTIVILPFADYTEADALAGAYRRNLTVTEALTDRLVANGFGMAIQEDVFGYLIEEEIISTFSYGGSMTTSLSAELDDEWSDLMKGHLKGYINSQKMHTNQSISDTPGTHAITQKAIAKMGRKFQADYVVRGRILEYKTRQDPSWAPWKKGLLPFVNGGTNRILNGFAASDAYDARNEALTGMIAGGIFGYNNGSFPWDDGTSFFGMADGAANTVFWAGAGAGLGHISATSGKIDQAAVQMRVWVQETATGNVVWTNRVRVLVSPESIFADKQYDTLFNQAIEKGVDSLVTHFVTYGL